jgi:hypothetical protein
VYDPVDGPRRWVPRLEILMLATLLVGVASVMLVRVVTDAADAGISLGGGWVVALFLAAVTVALNWIIYLVEFADGSEETHELDHWGKQLRAIERKEEELESKIRSGERQMRMARGDLPSNPNLHPAPAFNQQLPSTDRYDALRESGLPRKPPDGH